MSRTYQVISADGHLEIPFDPLEPYVPEEFRDRVPRLIKLREGGEAWLIEGHPLIHNGANLSAGRKLQNRGRSYWNPDGSPAPGAGDAYQRLREQDGDDLDAEVLFPPVFTSAAMQKIEDREAYRAIVRAYNTYLARDYCPIAPDRLIALGLIPASGIDHAREELRFCKEAGLKAVVLQEFPAGASHPRPEDDLFWEDSLQLAMPITAHTHIGLRYPPQLINGPPSGTPGAEMLATRQAFNAPMMTIAHLIIAGVFDRFPELRVYFAETQASWLACGLFQMDENAECFGHLFGYTSDKLPSEYIRKHVFFGFVRDPNCTHMGDLIPVENLMFGSDFPHSISSYPDTQMWIARSFDDLGPELRRRILLDNPADYFGLDLDKPITPTPS